MDFLYGYYVGKIEEGTLHYLLKATRVSAGGFVDVFEIRGIIETYRTELKNSIEKHFPSKSIFMDFCKLDKSYWRIIVLLCEFSGFIEELHDPFFL
jgi:hypothetical protein